MAAAFEKITGSKIVEIDDENKSHWKSMIKELYKHPTGIEFSHIRTEYGDYEDKERQETIEIGNVIVEYRYGKGMSYEWISLKLNHKEIASSCRDYGGIAPEQKTITNKDKGLELLAEVSAPFGLTAHQFIDACCKTFLIGPECFCLFLES